LTKGSAYLDNRPVVNEEDFGLAWRVAFDSMPPLRKEILEALIRGDNPRRINAPGSNVQYAIQDLELNGLLVNDRSQVRVAGLSQTMLRHRGAFTKVARHPILNKYCRTLPGVYLVNVR